RPGSGDHSRTGASRAPSGASAAARALAAGALERQSRRRAALDGPAGDPRRFPPPAPRAPGPSPRRRGNALGGGNRGRGSGPPPPEKTVRQLARQFGLTPSDQLELGPLGRLT